MLLVAMMWLGDCWTASVRHSRVALGLHAFVTSCRTNPRRLWEKLRGAGPPPPPLCVLTDMEVWRRHFAGLLSGGVERDEAAGH